MSVRKQSFVASDGFDVLFEGSKSFWKTRSNLDILVASHKKQLCWEIVAFNAEVGVEAPRLYLSAMLLASKVNQESDDYKTKLSSKKEALTRQKKTFNEADLKKEVYNEMMLAYVFQRLGVVSEGVDLTKELKMTLSPQSGDTMVTTDDETQRLDVICAMPGSLVPMQAIFQKKASASEISRAQYKLQAESAALRNATKMAELATMATDNFKAMMEEKRRIALEMKAFSKARLRWINAINRVLIQNYIAAVKDRLLNSSFAEWYKILMEKAAAEEAAEAAAAEEAEKLARIERESLARQKSIMDSNRSSKSSRAVGGAGSSKEKSKQMRRSLDNSQLPTSLPALGIDVTVGRNTDGSMQPKVLMSQTPSNSSSLPSLGSPSGKLNGPEKLLMDPMERRRQAKAEAAANGTSPSMAKMDKIGKALSRKSFGEAESEIVKSMNGFAASLSAKDLLNNGAHALSPVGINATPSSGGISGTSSGSPSNQMAGVSLVSKGPPSLIESYSEKVPKLHNQSSIPMLETVNELGNGKSTKSVRRPRA